MTDKKEIIRIVCVVIIILGLLAAGTFLVIKEHYGWAWIPFLAIFSSELSMKHDM